MPVFGQRGAPLRELLRDNGVALETGAAGAAAGARAPAGAGLLARNRAQAWSVLLTGLVRQGARLDQLRLERDEFERRLTLALRGLDEAARHPDPELRHALGVFAERVLVAPPDAAGAPGAPDAPAALEVLELLARLGALEYALLDVVDRAGVLVHDRGSPARFVAGEPAPGVALEPEPARLPPHVHLADALALVLRSHFPALGPLQVRQASQRLRRLGLFHPDHVYGQPTAAGREVLRLSRPMG